MVLCSRSVFVLLSKRQVSWECVSTETLDFFDGSITEQKVNLKGRLRYVIGQLEELRQVQVC